MLSISVFGQKSFNFSVQTDTLRSWKVQGKHLSDTIPERPKYKFFKRRTGFEIRSWTECETFQISNYLHGNRVYSAYKPNRVILDNEEAQFEVDLLGLDTSWYKEHPGFEVDDLERNIVFDSSKLFFRKNEDSSATVWWTYYIKEEDVTVLVIAKKNKP